MLSATSTAAISARQEQPQKRRHLPRSIPDVDRLPDSAFLTYDQVAALTGNAVGTIKLWGRQGRGPQLTRIEGRPRVRVGDYRAWIAGGSKQPPRRKTQTATVMPTDSIFA